MSTIAAIQMCSSDHLDENLKNAGKLLEKAADQGAVLAVLPEMFCLFGKNPFEKLAIKEKYGEGKIQDFLAQTAQKNNLWIVGGTIPLACENPSKIKAACLVYNAQGQCVGRYDKIHLFDVDLTDNEIHRESATIEAGRQCAVIQTPVGKMGLAVCYDIRFPALFTYLFQQGAEIFAIPAAFTAITGEAHWHVLARSRAIENFCYLVGACQAGIHTNGRKTYGHSLMINPWGKILSETTEALPGIIYAEINKTCINKARQKIPVHVHHKIMPDISEL